MNYEELRRVWKHIETNPRQHDQGAWYSVPSTYFQVTGTRSGLPYTNEITYQLTEPEWQCGTTACLAGWTAILNGWRPIEPNAAFVTDGEQVKIVYHVARKLLDLTEEQAMVLFDGDHTFDELRRYVEHFLATESA